MQDPRALASTKNLDSYRAWEREGLWRSGLNAFGLFAVVSAPIFVFAVPLIEHATKGDAGASIHLIGAALAVYSSVLGGLMLFGALRLNAWKRAHPWEPPSAPTLW